MFGYIGTNDSSVLNHFKDKFVSTKIGKFDSQTFILLCQQFSNLNIEILFLDISCSNDDAIVKGVRILRFHRSNTRIIILSSGRQPGDPTTSALVSLGVYDIISIDEFSNIPELIQEIERILLRPPNYADAARWHFQLDDQAVVKKTEDDQRSHPSAPPILDDFVIEPPQRSPQIIERLVGTANIAVAGVTHRTGSTHLAISLAAFLSRRNFDVACVELSENPVFRFIEESNPARGEGGFNRGADFYPMAGESFLKTIFSHHYQFIVMDLGCISDSRRQFYESELGRASVVFLTMGSSEWDFQYLVKTLDEFHSKGFGHFWNVIVNFSDPETFKEIQQAFTKSELEKLKVRFFRNPIFANPFHIREEQASIFEDCLSSIIPKKRRFKLF